MLLLMLCLQNILVFLLAADMCLNPWCLHQFSRQFASSRIVASQYGSTYSFLLHLCKSRLMFWAPVEGYFVLCQPPDGVHNLWQSGRKFWQVVDHPNKGLYLLLVCRGRHLGNGCDFVFIWLATTCSVRFTKNPLLPSYIATCHSSIAHCIS